MDLDRLRAYFLLIQSLAGGGDGNNDEDDRDDPRPPNNNSDVETVKDDTEIRDRQRDRLLANPVADRVMRDTMCAPRAPRQQLHSMVLRRELGPRSFTRPERAHATHRLVPQGPDVARRDVTTGVIDHYSHQCFCGQFSADGTEYVSATQDRKIRIYDTTSASWAHTRTIRARDVGWSVLCVDFSPDQRNIIYSSWCDSIHMCNIRGEEEKHEALDMQPGLGRFALFSVKFSSDSREILGGSCDQSLYVYDLDRRQRTVRVEAHADDINSCCFLDSASQIIASGSDDATIKIWDRRLLSTSSTNRGCVGVLNGHLEGITHVAPFGDEMCLVSNSKDQSAKLWDSRVMSTDAVHDCGRVSHWDYRTSAMGFMGRGQREVMDGRRVLKNDQSLMTYRGHRVLQTLIRCYVSPASTTGCRYLYTGSFDGAVYIYDLLTGDVVRRIAGHTRVVRDVSWHPHEPLLASASWDGSVKKWSGIKDCSSSAAARAAAACTCAADDSDSSDSDFD